MEPRQLGNRMLLLAHSTSAGSGGVWFHWLFTGEFFLVASIIHLAVYHQVKCLFWGGILLRFYKVVYVYTSVCVCVHFYEYLFITSSVFLDSYGSYFPWYAQSKASVARGQTKKVNPSQNWPHTVFSCVKLSCVKGRRNLQVNGGRSSRENG